MSGVDQAAKNSGWVFAGKAGERLLRIVVVVVLARALEARGFGVYAFAFAFAELFAVFSDFGLHAILVREISRDRTSAPRMLGGVLLLKAVLAALSWLIACAVALWTVPAGEHLWSTLVATFTLFVSFRVASLRMVLDAPFEAGLKMATPVGLGIASELFSAVCLIWAAWLRWPIPALIGVQLASLVPGVIFLAWVSLREVRPRLGIDLALWRRVLRAALPIGVANLCLIAYTRSDILMLEWMSGATSVGMYASAYRLTGSLSIVPISITTTLLPLMSAAHGAGDADRVGRIYRGAFSIAMAAALPIALGGYLLAGEIISLVYGAGYAPAAGALRVLSWAVAFNFLLYVMTTTAVALGRERLFTAYAAVLALLNLALNALLIPRYGFVGASWATLIAEGLMLAAAVAVLREAAGAPSVRTGVRALASAAVAGALLSWLPAPLAVRLGVSAALYAALVIWGGGITPEGASAFRFFLRRRTEGPGGKKAHE